VGIQLEKKMMHSTQIFIPPMGFEPVVIAFVRPQCLLLTARTHLNKFSMKLKYRRITNKYKSSISLETGIRDRLHSQFLQWSLQKKGIVTCTYADTLWIKEELLTLQQVVHIVTTRL